MAVSKIGRRPFWLPALICAATLAGCGGGGSGSSSRSQGSLSGPSSTASSSAASTTAPATTTSSTPAAPNAGTQGGASAAQSSPSQALAEADAICVQRNRELKGIPVGGSGLGATAKASSQRVGIEQRAVAELNALAPPPNSVVAWRTLLAETERSLREETKLAAAARAGDSTAVTHDLTKLANPGLRLLVAATRAHVKHCSAIG